MHTSVRCVVACTGGNGPTFYPVVVECPEYMYEDGDHYELAREAAEDQRYDGPFVVFDDRDGPDWLFDQFEWTRAIVVIKL